MLQPHIPNSNRFESSNRFQKSFHLHDNFTTANLEIPNCFQKLFRLHNHFIVDLSAMG